MIDRPVVVKVKELRTLLVRNRRKKRIGLGKTIEVAVDVTLQKIKESPIQIEF